MKILFIEKVDFDDKDDFLTMKSDFIHKNTV